MTEFCIFLLAALACLLFTARRRPWPISSAVPNSRGGPNPGQLRFRGARMAKDVAMPQLVRQLAALLAAGHGGAAVWGALAGVLASEFPLSRQESGGQGDDGSTHPTVRVVVAVQRASLLGFPTSEALRLASLQEGAAAHPLRNHSVKGHLSEAQMHTWRDLAACFEVSETSGAPVAAVLLRLADRLEAEEDAAAMRETALAGPRATVRLLTWLPFVGLGLGMLMGVNPVGMLLGTPVGWACLGAGIALLIVGRWWANGLISAASRPDPLHGTHPFIKGLDSGRAVKDRTG